LISLISLQTTFISLVLLAHLLAYLHGVEETREARRLRIEGTEIDEGLFDDDDDDPRGSRNPIHRDLSGDVRAFASVTGFSPADFSVLYEPLGPIFSARRRGREPVIETAATIRPTDDHPTA
jgi:hypothetical protein